MSSPLATGSTVGFSPTPRGAQASPQLRQFRCLTSAVSPIQSTWTQSLQLGLECTDGLMARAFTSIYSVSMARFSRVEEEKEEEEEEEG